MERPPVVDSLPDIGPRSSGPVDRLVYALFLLVATFFLGYLWYYYVTGVGGPTMLAVQMVPAAIVVLVLNDLRHGDFYPNLSQITALLIALVYIAVAVGASYYLYSEFDAIRMIRLGFWNTQDYIAGAAMTLLVLEYTRRKYMPVFIVNVILVLYCVYGFVVPGMFYHPGLPWRRVISATSLEMTTGVFERLPQLGLTLIGSFILLLAALQAFGCIESILKGSARIAQRRPRLLPQAAVIGSFAVAAVSGSGAANAATTGSATIPMFIRAGFPRVYAAAVETASSLGGQLMPPLMGISAFLMAEFLRVSYFDVVARGFAPAIIYFLGVALSVYLLASRFHTRTVGVEATPTDLLDRVNIAAYAFAVLGLIYLMGYLRWPPMIAAQRVFVWLLLFLAVVFVARMLWARRLMPKELVTPFVRLVGIFSVTTSELTILLSTLGILTAGFTITGVPDKVGVLMLRLAEFHLVAMVLTAFVFGYLVGMGLPVTPTYIVTAVVIAPFMIRAGVDPWVVHYFAFLVAVFGELSPPTSVTAAVTSRIAQASFMGTMFHAMGMCLPLLTMMGAIFARPELIVVPGLAQIPAFALVLTGTLGLSLALQGNYAFNPWLDRAVRLALGLLSALALFHPSYEVGTLAALPGAILIVYGLYRSRAGLLREAEVARA
jgi:TRAP transporter 4TM/12TM fusion protein